MYLSLFTIPSFKLFTLTLCPVSIEDKCYIKSRWHFVRDPSPGSVTVGRQGSTADIKKDCAQTFVKRLLRVLLVTADGHRSIPKICSINDPLCRMAESSGAERQSLAFSLLARRTQVGRSLGDREGNSFGVAVARCSPTSAEGEPVARTSIRSRF